MGQDTEITIDEFVDIFLNIYGEIDQKRSIEQLWLQVVEESASIAEAVREIEYTNLTMHIADMFCWFCGFINKLKTEKRKEFRIDDPLSLIIWNKFPNKCPFCQTHPCQCLLKREEIQGRTSEEKNRIYENVAKQAEATKNYRIKELNKLCDMFRCIFRPSYYVMPLEEITFHFMEEIGEVSEHIRKLTSLSLGKKKGQNELLKVKKDFKKEIADVFSWLCAIVIKLNYLLESNQKILDEFNYLDSQKIEISFIDIVKKYYFKDSKFICRTCKREKCDISKHKTYYQLK